MIDAINNLDFAIAHALYAARDPFLTQVFIWFTKLGATSTILALTVVVIILLARQKRWISMLGLLVSVFGAAAMTFILKELVARSRSEASVAAYIETGFSFPSWHAVAAISFYGFLLFLVWEKLPSTWKKLMAIAFGVIAVAIGFSRLYLGVHYLSDVVAGYLIGGAFLWLGIKLTRKLKGQ